MAEWIYVDKKSGATIDRPGLRSLLGYARPGDVIVVHTLDRLGRTVRDTLNLIHELTERGFGLRNLADPIKVNSSRPDDPMAQLALVLLALFGQMERTYTLERAGLARRCYPAMLPWLEQPYQAPADSVRYFPAMAPATRPAWTRTWPTAGLGRRPGRVGGGTGQARWSGPDPLVSLFVTIRLPDCSWPAVTVR